MQMFIRARPGIQRFEKQLADSETSNLWSRLSTLETQYQKRCPKCGKAFWVTEQARAKDWFDVLVGYNCPESGCDGIVKAEKK